MRRFSALPGSVRSFSLFVASFATALFAAPPADARITRIEIDAARSQSPTFGGFSWPGVGQYEKIVGIAHGEVNPHDRQNRVIVDIELAPRNARGNVEYSFNFYILKPIDLTKGAHRVMYEPPNRGGKTWTALGRVSGGGDDPGSITNADGSGELVSDAARLHALLERVGGPGQARHLQRVGQLPDRQSSADRRESDRNDYRPVLRIHCGGECGCVGHVELRGGDAGQDPGNADASRSSQRRAANHSCIRLELQRGRNGYQPRRREFRSERHLRVRVHRQGPQSERPGLRRRARLERMAALRDAGRLPQSQPARRRHQEDLYGDLVAARAAC